MVGLVLNRKVGDGENITRAQESAWDSLKHVEIMFAVEDHFSVKFSAEDLAALDSVSAIASAVERQLAP
jgi:acyl carrier protein